jgi:hypothetical protein
MYHSKLYVDIIPPSIYEHVLGVIYVAGLLNVQVHYLAWATITSHEWVNQKCRSPLCRPP